MNQDLFQLVNKESIVSKPSEEICKKIQGLTGLLELQGVSNWRSLDTRPEINIYGRIHKSNSSPSFRNLNHISTQDSISKSRTLVKPLPSSSSCSPRYTSKFRNSDAQVNDKILNTIILSKLNKFSESTYNDIRDFLYQILGSSDHSNEEFIKEFMNLVFEKAAREEIFCPLYAKLLSEISEKHPVILVEMNKLHENYLEIFKECDEDVGKDYNGFVKKNSEKKYRLGYSQFLAELIMLRILSSDKILQIFTIIIEQIHIKGKEKDQISLIEEYINCLLRITKVLRKRTEEFFIQIRTTLLPIVVEAKEIIDINKTEYVSVSTKSKFLFMDIQDFIKGL
jgi:hypothetical protein